MILCPVVKLISKAKTSASSITCKSSSALQNTVSFKTFFQPLYAFRGCEEERLLWIKSTQCLVCTLLVIFMLRSCHELPWIPSLECSDIYFPRVDWFFFLYMNILNQSVLLLLVANNGSHSICKLIPWETEGEEKQSLLVGSWTDCFLWLY